MTAEVRRIEGVISQSISSHLPYLIKNISLDIAPILYYKKEMATGLIAHSHPL